MHVTASLVLLLSSIASISAAADKALDPELQDPGIFIGAATVAATMIATDRRGKDFTPDVVAKAVKQSNELLKTLGNPILSGKTCQDTDSTFKSLADKFPSFVENLEQAACHDFIDRTMTRATLKEYGRTTEEVVPVLVSECPKFKKSLNQSGTVITDSVKQIVKSYSAGHCRAVRKKQQEEKAKQGKHAPKEENIKEL